MKFIAAVVAMGLDKRVWMREYWSTVGHYETNWYKTLFSRKRFVAIYSTMLHAGEACFIYEFMISYCLQCYTEKSRVLNLILQKAHVHVFRVFFPNLA